MPDHQWLGKGKERPCEEESEDDTDNIYKDEKFNQISHSINCSIELHMYVLTLIILYAFFP